MEAISNTFRQHLQKYGYFYILGALICVFGLPVMEGLIYDWVHDGNYSHGLLIIPLSVFLFYRRRNDLIFPASSSRLGLILFLFGCIGSILGVAASEFFTTRVALVMLITGSAWYVLGSGNFRKVWFAFAFMLFMIPLPSSVYYSATLPMQLFASKVTNNLLHIIGVPSTRQGNLIYLPAYTLEVSEACSGLRSLSTLLALGALYGNLTIPGKARPVVLFLSAIPIAIVVNVVRLLVSAVGAYAISTKIAEDFLHQLSGILVFVVALVIMAALGVILKWKRNPS